MHAPPWDPILSFLHTFSLKSAHIGGPRPPNGCTPPYGKSWIRHCKFPDGRVACPMTPATVTVQHPLPLFLLPRKYFTFRGLYLDDFSSKFKISKTKKRCDLAVIKLGNIGGKVKEVQPKSGSTTQIFEE